MSEQLKRLKEDYHKAFEEMMDFRAEMKKKEDDRRVLKMSHYLNKDRSPEDKAKFDEAKAKQEEMKEKYKDERQADAVKYARLKAKADTLLEQYEKLKEEEEEERQKDEEELERKKQEEPTDDGLADDEKELSKTTWKKPLAIACCIAIIVAGVVLFVKSIQDNKKDDDPLDLMGYTLSYACTKYKKNISNGTMTVVAKTKSELTAEFGEKDEAKEGVKYTDFPIDCLDYRASDKNEVWDYYIMGYSGNELHPNLIVGTKQQALAEGVKIRN